jgi:hypothetical protein
MPTVGSRPGLVIVGRVAELVLGVYLLVILPAIAVLALTQGRPAAMVPEGRDR